MGAVVQDIYWVSYLLVDLGWVDFDLGVSPSSPAAQTLLQNSHQPMQNWEDSGTLKKSSQPNPETPCSTVLSNSGKRSLLRARLT